MDDLMAFLGLKDQNLGEKRASAQWRQGFESFDTRNVTALQRGSFARQFQHKPLKTGRFTAGFYLTGNQNNSRQITYINGSWP